jgi:hypothetical protein
MQHYAKKAHRSFAVSVLSATLSMFLSTWGIMIAILSFIVGKNPGGASPAGFRSDSIRIVLFLATSCESHSQILLQSNSEKQIDLWVAPVAHDPEGEDVLFGSKCGFGSKASGPIMDQTQG